MTIIDANDVTDDNIICLLESQFVRAASFSMCHIYLGRKKEKPRGILLSFHFEWEELWMYASSFHTFSHFNLDQTVMYHRLKRRIVWVVKDLETSLQARSKL